MELRVNILLLQVFGNGIVIGKVSVVNQGFIQALGVFVDTMVVSSVTAFIILLLFLLLFSDIYHKYLLLSLGVTQAALRLARESDLA